jgi:hypothetical protein
MRLSRLDPEMVKETQENLLLLVGEDVNTGLADELYGEISRSCNGVWGTQKIIRIICALRAAQAILHAYVGSVQIATDEPLEFRACGTSEENPNGK